MTTLRQIIANRANSKLSTGPKTQAGREASKLNAVSHGLTADQVREQDEGEKIRRRLEDWDGELHPDGAYQRWLAEQAVAASVRIDDCRHQEDAWRIRQSERAASCWDADRRVEAERLAVDLGRRPALVALRLRQTLQGCEWLSARWRALGEALRPLDGRPIPLDEDGRRLAFDLLGLAAEQRLARTPLDPPTGIDDVAHQSAFIAAKVEELERHKGEVLIDLDEIDQVSAELGVGPGVDPTVRLIRRYETDAYRRMRRAMDELRGLQGGHARTRGAPIRSRSLDVSRPQEQVEDAATHPSPAFEPIVGTLPPRPPAESTPGDSDPEGLRVVAIPTPEPTSLTAPQPAAAVAAAAVAVGSLAEGKEPRTPLVVPAATRPAILLQPLPFSAVFAPAPPRNRHDRRAMSRQSAHRS